MHAGIRPRSPVEYHRRFTPVPTQRFSEFPYDLTHAVRVRYFGGGCNENDPLRVDNYETITFRRDVNGRVSHAIAVSRRPTRAAHIRNRLITVQTQARPKRSTGNVQLVYWISFARRISHGSRSFFRHVWPGNVRENSIRY